jgi:hypothetical protein
MWYETPSDKRVSQKGHDVRHRDPSRRGLDRSLAVALRLGATGVRSAESASAWAAIVEGLVGIWPERGGILVGVRGAVNAAFLSGPGTSDMAVLSMSTPKRRPLTENLIVRTLWVGIHNDYVDFSRSPHRGQDALICCPYKRRWDIMGHLGQSQLTSALHHNSLLHHKSAGCLKNLGGA